MEIAGNMYTSYVKTSASGLLDFINKEFMSEGTYVFE